MTRHFLGWETPFISKVIDWLWDRKESLAETLLVVPTAEAGRKVRQALAERGACFAPQVYTAGRFGALGYQGEENILLEQILWEQTLERYDWSQSEGVFPKPKADNWSRNLAEELRRLRVQTGEYGMTFHSVMQRLPEAHLDLARWTLLATWEAQYYRSIKQLGEKDSHEVRNGEYRNVRLPSKVQSIVLIGVTDPTEQAVRMARACSANGYDVEVLVSAPASEAEGIDDVGRPIPQYWLGQSLRWKDASRNVKAVSDARSLGACLLQELSEEGDEREGSVSLGIGDKEVTSMIKTAFKEEGIMVFDPAGSSLKEWSFVEWYRVWVRFSKQERVEDLRLLVRSPWTSRLLGSFKKDFYWMSMALAEVSESAKVVTISDLWHIKKSEWPFDGRDVPARRARLDDVLNVVQEVKTWRSVFKKPVSPGSLKAFLEKVLSGEDSEEALRAEALFLDLEKEGLRLPESYEVDFDFSQEYLTRLEKERVGAPRENVNLEALGWLELAFEEAPTLFITGLNEGVLPNTEIGDTWLPESLRTHLGMRTNTERYAHDVYYLKSLLEARNRKGKVMGFYLKTGLTGDPLKPSRLLLQVPREELGERVLQCFSGTHYSNMSRPWERDWVLSAPQPNTVKKLSPSSIKDYLQCPFRFYLKHVLRMQKPSETLQEWNNGEFGTIIHEVLENMHREPEVLTETAPKILQEWFYKELDYLIEKQFSQTPALAFQIQRDSIRQRLSFFAAVEAEDRLTHPGWTPISFEESFSFTVEGVTVRGIIDRIDQHEDGRLRVIDYKTGKEKSAEQAHFTKVTKATNLPPHLEDTDVMFSRGGKEHLWTNLQLPIYAIYCIEKYGKCPSLRYGLIGQTVADTRYSEWGFTPEDLSAAQDALHAVIKKVQDGVFYPPVERPRSGYDDYADLSYGFPLAEGVEQGEYVLNEHKSDTPTQTLAPVAPSILTQASLDL